MTDCQRGFISQSLEVGECSRLECTEQIHIHKSQVAITVLIELSDSREKMVHFKSIKMGSDPRHSKNLGGTQKFVYYNFGFPRVLSMAKSWPGIEDWILQLLVRVGLVLVQMSRA
jgi:hypothetical protein